MQVKRTCLAFLTAVTAFIAIDRVAIALYTSRLYDSLPRFMAIENICGWFDKVEPEWVADHIWLHVILGDIAQTAPFDALPFALFLFLYHRLMRRSRVSRFDGETRCGKCRHILRGLSQPRCPECGEKI